MSRNKTSYFLDVAMIVITGVLGVSSLVLWVVIPRGYQLNRLIWTDIHKWVGLTLIILVIIHAIRHREWLIRMTRRYITKSRAPDGK